jgi:DNA-nicking Smr family endonuclease
VKRLRGFRREAVPAPDDDVLAFRAAVQGVVPSPPANRVEPFRDPPRPIPLKLREDEQAVLAELARLTFDDDAQIEDDASYLRPGLPHDILRKLRRTHWVIQDDLDLHGLNAGAASLATAEFLSACKRRGLRCVRIVHGKGLRSPGREPVLKRLVRKLLTRREEVLAFVEPRAVEGGGGAVVVLLEA